MEEWSQFLCVYVSVIREITIGINETSMAKCEQLMIFLVGIRMFLALFFSPIVHFISCSIKRQRLTDWKKTYMMFIKDPPKTNMWKHWNKRIGGKRLIVKIQTKRKWNYISKNIIDFHIKRVYHKKCIKGKLICSSFLFSYHFHSKEFVSNQSGMWHLCFHFIIMYSWIFTYSKYLNYRPDYFLMFKSSQIWTIWALLNGWSFYTEYNVSCLGIQISHHFLCFVFFQLKIFLFPLLLCLLKNWFLLYFIFPRKLTQAVSP